MATPPIHDLAFLGLHTALRQGHPVVALIGAGMSIPDCDDANALRAHLLGVIGDHEAVGDLSQVAQRAWDHDAEGVRTLLVACFGGKSPDKTKKRYRALVRAGFRVIVSLNYDTLLDEAIRSEGLEIERPDVATLAANSKLLQQYLDEPGHACVRVLQIHGRIDGKAARDIVLTTGQYAEAYRKDGALRRVLRQIFLNAYVCCFGYGGGEDRMIETARLVHEDLRATGQLARRRRSWVCGDETPDKEQQHRSCGFACSACPSRRRGGSGSMSCSPR